MLIGVCCRLCINRILIWQWASIDSHTILSRTHTDLVATLMSTQQTIEPLPSDSLKEAIRFVSGLLPRQLIVLPMQASSPLLRLPIELRQAIWAYALSPLIELTLSTSTSGTHDQVCVCAPLDKKTQLARPKSRCTGEVSTLLLLCKCVRAEVRNMFGTSLLFLQNYVSFIIRINDPLCVVQLRTRLPVFDSLKKVELRLDLFEHSDCPQYRKDHPQMFSHFYDLIRQLPPLIRSRQLREVNISVFYNSEHDHFGRNFEAYTQRVIERLLEETSTRENVHPSDIFNPEPDVDHLDEFRPHCEQYANDMMAKLTQAPSDQLQMNFLFMGIKKKPRGYRVAPVKTSSSKYILPPPRPQFGTFGILPNTIYGR